MTVDVFRTIADGALAIRAVSKIRVRMGQVGLAADSATVKRLTLFSYSLGLALDAAMAAPGAQDDAFAEKEEVVEWMMADYSVDKTIPETIAKTTSCYHHHDQFCWACPNCFYFLCAVWNYKELIPLDLTFKNQIVLEYYFQKAHQGRLPPKRKESVLALYKEFMV